MNLCFDTSRASGYKSPSQITRVLTEDWAARNLYCVSCSRNSLHHVNEKVVDFVCENCKETYQLKSRGNPLGHKVVDAAYEPMVAAIRGNKAPNLFLLHYDAKIFCTENLLVVPKYFLTLSCIERRKALSPDARRAGWVGCNIVLREVPPDGRIPIIKERKITNPAIVRSGYDRFRFLSMKRYDARGWMADVLKVVRDLGKKGFTLDEVYAFEKQLQRLHPNNRNIRPKIRQQLQVLRDKGILHFRGGGLYEFIGTES